MPTTGLGCSAAFFLQAPFRGFNKLKVTVVPFSPPTLSFVLCVGTLYLVVGPEPQMLKLWGRALCLLCCHISWWNNLVFLTCPSVSLRLYPTCLLVPLLLAVLSAPVLSPRVFLFWLPHFHVLSNETIDALRFERSLPTPHQHHQHHFPSSSSPTPWWYAE